MRNYPKSHTLPSQFAFSKIKWCHLGLSYWSDIFALFLPKPELYGESKILMKERKNHNSFFLYSLIFYSRQLYSLWLCGTNRQKSNCIDLFNTGEIRKCKSVGVLGWIYLFLGWVCSRSDNTKYMEKHLNSLVGPFE